MAEAAPQSPSLDIPALLQRAVGMHQGGRLREAEKLYKDVLAAQPDNFDALHLYGVLMHQRGQPVEALRLIGAALKANARAAAAHSNHGMVLAALNRDAEAVESYDRAIALQPDFAGAINNRGNALRKLGRNEEAIESFERALALNPGYPEALNNRGNALVAMQRTAEALKSYDAALAQRPSYVDALVNRAEALRRLAREDEAMASLDRALALKPDHPAALQGRAQLRQARGDIAGALADLERLAPQKSGDAGTQAGLGHLLRELGRFDEALGAYDRALALKPDDARTHNCRGNVLIELNRLEEALAAYDRALAIDPGYTFALVNRGSALRYLGRTDEALASFDRALALAPDLADAHWNKALLQLSQGDFANGFAGYEWRWRRGVEAPRGFAAPQWQGEDLKAKTILLHAEQGLGDSIQMLRYLPLVAQKAAKIVLELPEPLLPLVDDPAVTPVARGAALPPFDVHCPLMSLPLAFGTTCETIPADVPYLQGAGRAAGDVADEARRHCGAAHRPRLVGPGRPRQRSQPQHSAFAPCAGLVGAGRAVRQPAGRDPRARPGRSRALAESGALRYRIRRFCRYRGGDCPSRPGDRGRHGGRPPCRRARQAGLDPRLPHSGLALVPRPRRQSLVPERAPVPATHARRLGQRHHRARDGAGRIRRDAARPKRLGHDPEKWEPVFGKDHAQTKC